MGASRDRDRVRRVVVPWLARAQARAAQRARAWECVGDEEECEACGSGEESGGVNVIRFGRIGEWGMGDVLGRSTQGRIYSYLAPRRDGLSIPNYGYV